MNFSDHLESVVRKKNSCLLLSLDPNPEKMPDFISKTPEGIYTFCKQVMDACADKICGVKINMAFFEVFGAKGILIVEQLLKDAKELKLITIADAKRGDIGSTAKAYAEAYLGDGPLGSDALTISGYCGDDGVRPFIDVCEKNKRGIFVWVHASNPSFEEIQAKTEISIALAEKVEEWNLTSQSEKNNLSAVGAVIGATNAEALKFFREEMPHAWFLCPGVGAQGGNIEDVLKVRKDGIGVLIPVGRSILYAGDGKDFAQKSAKVMGELYELQKV